MFYWKKLFLIAVILSGFSYNTLSATEHLMQQGIEAIKKAKISRATEIFWQVAHKGNPVSIEFLSALYCIPFNNFDDKVFSDNIPAVTEKLFPYKDCSKLYTRKFIIVTSEQAICDKSLKNIAKDIKIEKFNLKWKISLLLSGNPFYAGEFILDLIKKFKDGNYLMNNIQSFSKSLAINTAKGKVYARSRNIEDLGEIAVVDSETAKKYFSFSILPEKDWSVYVRCPGDEDCLIPFADFHKFVYEKKMQAFIRLCRYLGATTATISYGEKNTKKFDQEYEIAGSHKSGIKASSKVNVDTTSTQSELAKYNFNWSGSSTIHPVQGYWLSIEPSWKEMHDSRLDLSNPIKGCTVDFNYTNDYSVNVRTKTCFENAEMNISFGTNHQFQKMQEKSWCFNVKFPIAVKEISKETKILK